jgi:hypothetical protein
MYARCLETGEVYFHLKEEALDRIKWRNRFGRGFGQITDDDDDDVYIYILCLFSTGCVSGPSLVITE